MPEPIRVMPYICELDGHIMDGWTVSRGLPNGEYTRRCVIPGCKFHQTKEAPKS